MMVILLCNALEKIKAPPICLAWLAATHLATHKSMNCLCEKSMNRPFCKSLKVKKENCAVDLCLHGEEMKT